jgi:hypothetical protein
MTEQEWQAWQTVLLLGSKATPVDTWLYPDQHRAILAADRVLRAARKYAVALDDALDVEVDRHSGDFATRQILRQRAHNALLAAVGDVGEPKEAGDAAHD